MYCCMQSVMCTAEVAKIIRADPRDTTIKTKKSYGEQKTHYMKGISCSVRELLSPQWLVHKVIMNIRVRINSRRATGEL